jgi:hypothetical protein
MARTMLLILFGIIFAGGLWPPESAWLMGIGLGGFILALYVPKYF